MATKETNLTIPTAFKIGDSEINVATLEKRIAEDTKHVITGTADTAGYKQAVALRAQYRTTRTTLAKVVKEMSQPYKDYIAGLKKATEEIGAIAFKGETYFDTLITEIDDEKACIKAEEEAERQRVLQSRISDLNRLGAIFDGDRYTFSYDADLYIGMADVKDLSEEEFTIALESIEEAYNKEQQRIADELLVKEQEAEEQRKQAEANELEARILKDKRTRLRIKELYLLGFYAKDGIYKHADDTLPWSTSIEAIETLSDEDWDLFVTPMDSAINDTPSSDEQAIADFGALHVFDNHLQNKSTPTTGTEPLQDLDLAFEDIDTLYKQIGYTEAVFRFDKDEPFEEITIGKLKIRLFPDEYQTQALAGVAKVKSNGKVQSLNWIAF